MQLYGPPYELKELKIEVTQQCPLNCIHCSSEAGISKLSSFPKKRLRSLLREANNLGVEEIIFSGGEPFMWPYFQQTLRYCVSFNLKISIYTMGIIDEKLSPFNEEIVNLLKDTNIQKVVFSLFSNDPKVHDRITRVNSFDITMQSLRFVKDNGIKVELHFVPMQFNYSCLPGLIELAKANRINKVSILRFVPHGRGSLIKDKVLDKDMNLKMRKDILELRKQGEVEIRLGSPYNFLCIKGNEGVYCNAAKTRMLINPNGDIFPCDAFKNIHHDGKYNNVLANKLSEVWKKSEYLNEVRKYLTSPLPTPCDVCNNLSVCKSGCLAQKVVNYRAYKKDKDPDCLLH